MTKAANWLEELAENWFRMRGYMTQLHVRIPKFGRRELDLLAFDEKEFVMVDLKTYLVSGIEKEANELIKRFNIYEQLPTTPPYSSVAKNKKLKRLFIATGKRGFKKLIANSGIDFMPMEDFLHEVLKEVEKYAVKERWPFSSDDISRLLYELSSYELIK